jgi:hypothetical protein
MKRKHMYAAVGEAFVLADVLQSRLPACCGAAIPREDLFAAVWPLAVRLTRLERRAKKDKAAARYRAARAEAAEMLRGAPDTVATLQDLMRSVPLDPARWHTALRPDVPATALEAA